VTRVHASAAPGSVRLDFVGSVDAARTALDDGARIVLHNLTLQMLELFRRLRVTS